MYRGESWGAVIVDVCVMLCAIVRQRQKRFIYRTGNTDSVQSALNPEAKPLQQLFLPSFNFFIEDMKKRGHYCLRWRCLCLCSAQPGSWRLPAQRPQPEQCGWRQSTPGGTWHQAQRPGRPYSPQGWRTPVCGLDSRTCTTTAPPAPEWTLFGTDTGGPRTGRASQSAASPALWHARHRTHTLTHTKQEETKK